MFRVAGGGLGMKPPGTHLLFYAVVSPSGATTRKGRALADPGFMFCPLQRQPGSEEGAAPGAGSAVASEAWLGSRVLVPLTLSPIGVKPSDDR